MIEINLKGLWLCMKYEIPRKLGSGGCIVNCSSIAGMVGFPSIPAYTVSKHGMLGLTKAAALEYADRGIRVNVVCPGVIRTAIVERFTGGRGRRRLSWCPGNPWAGWDEVASAVLWLCSPGAGFVTGHSLVIGGGWVAR